MIKLEAFEPFKEANPELAATGKYGVLVLDKGTWIPLEITEEDFGKYKQVHPQSQNQTDEDKALHEAAFETNKGGHSAWVLVELV